jgi:2-polyprenyl-3-methyl-5-hydroxy-6-metoxy-1,4-benzoquinol methylase
MELRMHVLEGIPGPRMGRGVRGSPCVAPASGTRVQVTDIHSTSGSKGEFEAIFEAIEYLPHPLHIFATLTGSLHYHFGLFVEGDSSAAPDALVRAMSRLSLRCLDFLPPASRVLDVGCGMGGTALLLAGRGHEVVGVDPCEHSIACARSALDGHPGGRFFSCGLQEFAALRPDERFDAVIVIEASHRLPSLEVLVASSRALLRPGGLLFVQDVVLNSDAGSLAVPFHARGFLARLGGAMGFVVRRQNDLTAAVLPTLGCLTERLHAERRSLIERFACSRPEIASEIEELRVQLQNLANAFSEAHLVYEEVALQVDAADGENG